MFVDYVVGYNKLCFFFFVNAQVCKQFTEAGFMAEADLDSSCLLNKKIRNAQLAQYNFILGECSQKHFIVSLTHIMQDHHTKPIFCVFDVFTCFIFVCEGFNFLLDSSHAAELINLNLSMSQLKKKEKAEAMYI